MKIRITKRGRRNEMRCLRADGTQEFADLGPGLPHHDLAHFVVEQAWHLRQGFYGNIANGYTFAQLSDKNVIRTLGPESAQAEVLARAMQSLHTGACTAAQFAKLVKTELQHWNMPTVQVPASRVKAGAVQFKKLVGRFDALGDGESLDLDFSASRAAASGGGVARKSGVNYATVRKVALALPDVTDSSTLRGISFKARGRLLACKAVHRSAEPDSLLVRVGATERDRLLATLPAIYYLTPHYLASESVLVRLARIDARALQALLADAWQVVTASLSERKPAKGKRTDSVFRYL